MDATDNSHEAADHIEYYANTVADKHVHRATHRKLHSLTQGVADGTVNLDQLEEGIHSLKELKQHHADQSKTIELYSMSCLTSKWRITKPRN